MLMKTKSNESEQNLKPILKNRTEDDAHGTQDVRNKKSKSSVSSQSEENFGDPRKCFPKAEKRNESSKNKNKYRNPGNKSNKSGTRKPTSKSDYETDEEVKDTSRHNSKRRSNETKTNSEDVENKPKRSNESRPRKFSSHEQVKVSNLTKQMYSMLKGKDFEPPEKNDSTTRTSPRGRGFSKTLAKLRSSDSESITSESTSLNTSASTERYEDASPELTSLERMLQKAKRLSREKTEDVSNENENPFDREIKPKTVNFYPSGHRKPMVRTSERYKRDQSLPRVGPVQANRPRDKSLPRDFNSVQNRPRDKAPPRNSRSEFRGFVPVSHLDGSKSPIEVKKPFKAETKPSKPMDEPVYNIMRKINKPMSSEIVDAFLNNDAPLPEPSAKCTKMEVAAGKCFCETCTKWIDTNEPFFYDLEQKPAKKKIAKSVDRPGLMLKPDFKDSDSIQISMKKRMFQNSVAKFVAPKVLIHGQQHINCISAVADAPVHPSIHRALKELKIENVDRIQAYSWTSVIHCDNTVVVNGPRTNKKMSYLPALCSNVLSLQDGHLKDRRVGPYVVILVPKVRTGDDIAHVVSRLYQYSRDKPKVTVAVPPLGGRVTSEISSGVDILITTPRVLLDLIDKRVTKLKRCCHLVLQNADLLLKNFPEELETAFDVVQNVLSKRTFAVTVQMIIVSRTWTAPLERLVKRLTLFPIICIGAYVEAALYGRANIQIRMVNSKMKPKLIDDMVKDCYLTTKTVVVCSNQKEVDDIYSHLEKYAPIRIDENSNLNEQKQLNKQWHDRNSGEYPILIGTDQLFRTSIPLNIMDASLVVMYSLPETLKSFTNRFSLFLDNLTGPFVTYENETSIKCSMHLFVDENCGEQFNRIISLIERFGAHISEDVWQACTKLLQRKETNKITDEIELCRNLKLFGICHEMESCQGRHRLDARLDVDRNIPQSGIVKLRILYMHDVTHYAARLIEHVDASGAVHVVKDKFAEIALKLAALSNEKKRKPVYHVDIGTVCAVEESKSLFRRCKVTHVISRGIMNKPERVQVKLLDVGSAFDVSAYVLYELPDKSLVRYPPQAVDVYLADLGPVDNDTDWSSKCQARLQKLLNEAGYEEPNCYFSGRIKLQLGNSLWVNNLILREYAPSGTLEVFKFSALKALIDNGLVEKRPHHLEMLHEYCKDSGIELPDYSLPVVKSTDEIPPQVVPNWAHLENCEEYNMVHLSAADSPGQFFLRMYSHQSSFDRMVDEIQSALNRPHYPTKFPVVEGRCYLAKDPQGSTYGRVLVRKLENDRARCFFVDHGDYITVHKSELKFLSDELISLLPFQVIECELHGVRPRGDAWTEASIDALYDLTMETNSDFLRCLHVKFTDKRPGAVTNGTKYSVVLIDTMECKIVNEEFVRAGLGAKIEGVDFGEIDFEALRPKFAENDADSDNEADYPVANVSAEKVLETIRAEKRAETEIVDDDDLPDGEKSFDIQINDYSAFVRDAMNNWRAKHAPLISRDVAPAPVPSNLPALPPADYATPTVEWFQTDKNVAVKIKIPGVESFDLAVTRNRFFSFGTFSNDRKYQVKLTLYAKVKLLKKEAKGFYVYALMEKLSGGEWERLVTNKEKLKYIIYDPEKIYDKKVVEEKVEIPFLFDEEDKPEYVFEYGSDFDYNESDVESISSHE